MNFLNSQRLSVSILLFSILFIGTWPLYRFVSDLDGIGYAAVSHHYIDGNWRLAVNGFWNPLHSWLVIPLIKAGMSDWTAFKVSNAIFSIGSLFVLNSFINQFSISTGIKTCIQLVAVILLLHYTYYELAGDALLVLLLLVYFRLVHSDNFYESVGKNILAGVLGACLYFAKSYGFPFFLFHFTVIHLILNPNKLTALKQIAIGVTVFVLVCFPWLLALHWKYGEWMIAFGKFNAHWDFSKGPLPGPVIQPPPYEGAASVWEDPWHVRKNNFSNVAFSAIALHQIRVILFNFQQWLICIHDLSFFSSAILFVTAIKWFSTKNKTWLYLLITLLTLPAGYILLHVETRFIWVLSFVFMIAGSLLLQSLLQMVPLKKWLFNFAWIIFFGSFLLEPINQLKDQIYQHQSFFTTVDLMQSKGIHGKFTSNAKKGDCMVVAYLSKNSYYTITKPSFSTDELLAEIKQYGIQHYFFYYSTEQEKELFLTGKIAKTAPKMIELAPDLLVFSFY